MFRYILRPILFLFPAERAHRVTFALTKFFFKIPFTSLLTTALFKVKTEPVELFGLTFPNRVGLAAGFDKNAELIDELSNFGFGFIEIGTVTPKPQAGNPKPRLFRLKKDQAIINRMGFNNDGLSAVIERLKKRKSSVLVGGNIGKNKEVPNEDAKQDYEKAFVALVDHVDYFVINVSSPNTPNLRELQEKKPLTDLLLHIQKLNTVKKPILLKIAPDLTHEQLNDIIDIVESTKIDGLIATNTTVTRDNLFTHWKKVNAIGHGGLSGKPVREKSTEIIRYIHEKSKGKIPIIAVGGIHSAKDAEEKLHAGAKLVQVYTGFIYEGPSLIKKINRKLS